MKKLLRTPLIYILILVAIILLATEWQPFSQSDAETLDYGVFLEKASGGEIAAAQLILNELVGVYKDSEKTEEDLPNRYDFSVTVPSEQTFTRDMAAIASEKTGKDPELVTAKDYGFSFAPVPPPSEPIILQFLPYIFLIGIVIVFWYFMMQQSQGSGNKVMSFGKSRARASIDEKNKVTFANVAGADEEKEELKEVVDFLKDPKRFTEMGARIPKGVLLVGPPGTGKTLLAKAVAGEADAPFFSISGSDFVEMFVGVGASRVRDLFNTAKKSTPAIIFIDEIDAVGRHRGAGLGGGHDEREQTLNQLLVEMDGFSINEGVIIIAATNRPDILDPALLRPGRFDRQITVNFPDVKGREEILKVHAKGKPLAKEVVLKTLAKRTPGFTGADLENVLNEAAILGARAQKKEITMVELEEAITRVVVGPEKRSRVVTEDDQRITAYHEAGHAIVAHTLEHCDPVHEVSIIARGRAAGYTMALPKDDRQHLKRSKMLDDIAMLLAGRVAESLMVGDISTGASNDLQRATELARKMVVEFGMSDNIGPIFLGNDTEIFIGKDFGHQRNYSEDVAMKVDREIREILEKAYTRAKNILEEGKEGLERVKEALLEHERLDGEEFAAYYENREVPVKDAAADKSDENPDVKALESQAQDAPEGDKNPEDAGKGENFDRTV